MGDKLLYISGIVLFANSSSTFVLNQTKKQNVLKKGLINQHTMKSSTETVVVVESFLEITRLKIFTGKQ